MDVCPKRRSLVSRNKNIVPYHESCNVSIVLQLIYWDDKAIYLEQQFVTLRDGFVRAVVLSRQNVVDVNVNDLMDKLVGSDVKKPEIPEELEHWLKGIEVSSAKLRKSD